jgi:hypothetical protein
MRNRIGRLVAPAALALCVVAAGAQGQGKGQGKGHGNGHGNGKGNGDGHGVAGVDGRSDERGEVGRENRIPPGLAKKGGLPPGQAKKMYRPDEGVSTLTDVFGRHGYTVVRTESYGDSRYVYYRQRNGAIRRAVVMPGTDRLGFRNVPSSLLQEVLSRLY